MAVPIICCGNNKGGVGKTFLVKTIAEYANRVRGLRVLLLDLDPQTNLSRRYLDMQALVETGDYGPPQHPEFDPQEDPDWDGFSDAADIWLEGSAAPYPTQFDGLEIIPGHATKLQDLEYVRRGDIYDQVLQWLRNFLHLEDVQGDYDLILLDTRPSKGPLVQAAMHAATHLLIPTQLEAPAVEGLQGMLHQRRLVNRERPADDPLRLIGLLPNMVRRTVLHREYRELLQSSDELSEMLLPAELSDWVDYRESMVYGADSLFDVHGPATRVRQQLDAVCASVLDRMKEAA